MQRGVERILALQFGRAGNEAHYLGAGWSGDEAGSRWMVGGFSVLWLENPGAGLDLILELDVGILPAATAAVAQRLALEVRDRRLTEIVVATDGSIGFRIPAEAIEGAGPVKIVFGHPDCKRPADVGLGPDDRYLSFWVSDLRVYRVLPRPKPGAAPRLPLRRAIERFESIGDNCEFGLLQRALKAEPLGLFRFSFISVPTLLRGLRSDFGGQEDLGAISVSLAGKNREYLVRESHFGMTYHTFQHDAETDIATVADQQLKRLRYLKREFIDDVAVGRKIYVVKQSPEPLMPHAMLPVYTALNERGANWLLWMVPGDAANPVGTVTPMLPGLLRGNIDRFAPLDDAADLSQDCWVSVCKAAWKIAGGALRD